MSGKEVVAMHKEKIPVYLTSERKTNLCNPDDSFDVHCKYLLLEKYENGYIILKASNKEPTFWLLCEDQHVIHVDDFPEHYCLRVVGD